MIVRVEILVVVGTNNPVTKTAEEAPLVVVKSRNTVWDKNAIGTTIATTAPFNDLRRLCPLLQNKLHLSVNAIVIAGVLL
jgi:hypothetical protein